MRSMKDTATTDFIGVLRASEILDVSIGTVYNWARSGRLPSYRAGSRWLFREDDVMELKDKLRPYPYLRPQEESNADCVA